MPKIFPDAPHIPAQNAVVEPSEGGEEICSVQLLEVSPQGSNQMLEESKFGTSAVDSSSIEFPNGVPESIIPSEDNAVPVGPTNDTIFGDILQESLVLPAGWARANHHHNGLQVAVFYLTELRNSYSVLSTINLKEVIVNSNLEITATVLHHPVNLPQLKLTTSITSIEMLQDLLCSIHHLKICNGCKVPEELKQLETDVTFKDSQDILRHINCQWLTRYTQCLNCRQGKRTLRQRHSRHTSQPTPKRIRIRATGAMKRHLIQKNNKITNSKKRIVKLRRSNQGLRERLEDCQKQVSEMSQVTLEESLNKHAVTNHRTVVMEIFNAAKWKGPKGNRYGEDWLMLCILLHMRSPTGYRFINENHILPLPSVSTIKR